MRRFMLAAIALAATLAPGLARAQGQPQTLVDRSTLAIQEMMTQRVSQDPRIDLQRARAVMICPRVFKAGFILGGSGGDCVLLARAGNGTWSYPSFYTIGSGSIGFQAGIEDSSLVMMVMTGRGLNAVLDSQFKLGADASVAIATIGGTVGGATTAAVGADIVVFAQTRGLFGGVSLEGSLMALLSTWNAAYYGQPLSARQVVMQMLGSNQGADPLREVLTRFGSAPTTQAAAPGYPPGAPGYSQGAAAYPPNGPGYSQNGPAYPPGNQGYAPAAPRGGYAPAYPPVTQGSSNGGPGYGGGQEYSGNQGYNNDQGANNGQGYGGNQGNGGQPIPLQPNGPVQEQALPPPGR